MLFRLLFALALLLGAGRARADFAFTTGSGQTMFTFTASTGGTSTCAAANTHCFPHVNINSAGTEIFTATTPGYARIASGFVASGAYASGSIASGAMVDLGAIADAASTAGGTGTLSAKLRLMTTQLDNINTNIQASLPAGTAIIGGVYMYDTAGSTKGTIKAASTAAVLSDTALVVTPILQRGSRNFPGCTVGATTTNCLASSTALTFLQVQNVHASNTIACAFGVSAVLNDKSSVQLAAGQSASWGPNTMGVPTGQLNCIASAGSTPMYLEWN